MTSLGLRFNQGSDGYPNLLSESGGWSSPNYSSLSKRIITQRGKWKETRSWKEKGNLSSE